MIRHLKNFLKNNIPSRHYTALKNINIKIKAPIILLKLKLNEKSRQAFLDSIDRNLKNLTEPGIRDNGLTNKIIISLTSFPERMDEIHYALYSLLTQTFKPDMLVLWLGEEQFPNKESDIPEKAAVDL